MDSNEFIGTYRVALSDPSQITLTIYADQTFHYQDFSIPNKKIAVTGTWKQQGGEIRLQGSNSEYKFHDVWAFDKNGQVATSRKGLTFYSLCKIN